MKTSKPHLALPSLWGKLARQKNCQANLCSQLHTDGRTVTSFSSILWPLPQSRLVLERKRRFHPWVGGPCKAWGARSGCTSQGWENCRWNICRRNRIVATSYAICVRDFWHILALGVKKQAIGWKRHFLAEGGGAFGVSNGYHHQAESIGLKLGLQKEQVLGLLPAQLHEHDLYLWNQCDDEWLRGIRPTFKVVHTCQN